MLTVYTRHTSKCPKKDNPAWRRCRCWKWIMGTVPGRPGSLRVSAKTRSWEQAESLARKYEITAEGGDEVKEARTLPTVKEAVKGYLADAEARGLAPATIQKLEHIFKKQLLAFSEQHRIIFLRDVNVRNMTEWRSTWADKPLARKKKFERVVGFFWFCVRHGWLKDNPTATMGRVIAKHVPTDYFTADEYKRIIGATYRLGEDAERSWAPEKRGMLRLPVKKQRRNGFRYLTSEKGRDSIANLDVLGSPRSGEEIVIWE